MATLGGSFVVSTSSTVLSDRHETAGPAAVSEANAAAAGVGTFAPLVVPMFLTLAAVCVARGGPPAVSLGWVATPDR